MKTLRSALYAAAVIALLISAASCALPAVMPERRALLIGINDYIDPTVNDLDYPVQDAADMKAILKASNWIVDTPLIDHAATKAAIQSTISSFFTDLPPNGTALIYFSGHGVQIGDTSYLVPSDYDGDYSQMISPVELAAWINDSITTKNVIFIADSCFSGDFVHSGDSVDGIASPYDSSEDETIWIAPLPTIAGFADLLALNAAATGDLDIIAISAAGHSEESYEYADLENGVFTHFLIEAAIYGDRDGNGFVTCTEAYSYAARKVDTYWNDSFASDFNFYPHMTGGWRDLVLF